MSAYKDMTPLERFEWVDRMATQLFGTNRWNTEFCRAYAMSKQGVNKWMHDGAPVWAVVALSDALAAQNWEKVKAAVLNEDSP